MEKVFDLKPKNVTGFELVKLSFADEDLLM